jgi:hypothetical protein
MEKEKLIIFIKTKNMRSYFNQESKKNNLMMAIAL